MNLLSNPNNWSDGTQSPPACWNGTSYVASATQGDYVEIFLTFIGSYTGSDTLGFTYANATTAGTPADGSSIIYLSPTPGDRTLLQPTGNNGGTEAYAVPTGLTQLQVQLLPGSAGEALGTNTVTVTPPAPPTPVASDETISVASNSNNNSVTTSVTQDGSPVDATLAIASQATNGSAFVLDGAIVYTPNVFYHGPDSFTYTGTYDGNTSAPATVSVAVVPTNYNCECSETDYPTKTLKQLRIELMTRLGFAAMMVPPPGMVPLLNSFLIEAQELLFRRYKVFRGERWFTWSMLEGQRFYDFNENDDAVNGSIQAPTGVSVATDASAGALIQGTYGYVVTALNANGETNQAVEVQVITTGPNSTNTVTWAAVTGATGYIIYGNGPLTYQMAQMAQVGSGTTSFQYNGSITPSGNAPPLVNTTGACSKTLDPRAITWVGISQNDNNWRPLSCGIDPLRYTSIINSIPDSYECRQCIEIWPGPPDNTWSLRIKGYFGLQSFVNDNDQTTIDYRAVFMLALGNAKMHYGQPDAQNVQGQLTTFLGDLIAGTHNTRRYIPVNGMPLNAVRPRRVW